MKTGEKWVAGAVALWFVAGPFLLFLSGTRDPITVWGLPFIGLWLLIGLLGVAARVLRHFGH